MASANTGGFRLVRCPKCLNILPEPANDSVYQCGGCNTTLRAKIRVSDAQNVATKQVRQDSGDYSVLPTVSNGASTKQVRQDSSNYSVVTSGSNGVSPQSNELGSIGAAADDSITLGGPRTEIQQEGNGTGSSEKGDIMSDEENVMEVADTESSEDDSSDGQDTNGQMEDLAALMQPSGSGNGTHIVDSDKEENNTVEQSAENSEACKINQDGDMESSLNTPEQNMTSSEDRELASNLPESEESGARKTEPEPAASKRSKLVRVHSRSCDLREVPGVSVDSLNFHSSRTSFQSKSFRASEPLQSKIMKTVDELKGDLSEIFNEPSDCKPRARRPHPLKQDGYSQPLTAYHPAVKHSGYASRLSRSGQVAPHGHGLPLPRYGRRSAYSYIRSGQLEMRPCPHQCHHSCRPPCCSSWKQEPAPQKPPAMETKRRPASRNLCRPVLRGAPFVLCSNCLRLVQLPTDFAIPSRGTRRLQCGSCAQVLSYSYRDPNRKKLESPFGGDESSTDDSEIHQVSDDHNTGAHQAEPYSDSYSEEYGISAGVSYSTEDERPLHVSRNSSFNTIDERSGKESKLHRLMGYSSASELMRHSPDLYESFSRRTPNARTYDVKGKGVCMTDGSDAKDGAVKGSKAKERRMGLPFQGMFKKGIHGLESLRLGS
ncbi:hypothetical protein CFC21_061738 [Triticum aestivum]|uniref:Uncharacterized protein n=2 Tax=Triticum aestivum TaxID=4565 RepID=A0A3B6JHC6_WHEAT|nr:protein ENHANCED DISEASE RESISTANCE 4-like [Triticum aestivum]XP_044375253.1 protein ENHANCED DISEASE RESISTANCE 4-like [Triticum aestivum]XP_044375254.1 protein ENHANCED DISEASE RESISTANCE 4-like [Triticum aestivum]XP_044375255.1 protein ENHANCED DISEASE RESISTANCE 4-like [Triticum aestivum]KAF7053938.1 hypothetical protein CFC21_061738 [Triticum aestivum]